MKKYTILVTSLLAFLFLHVTSISAMGDANKDVSPADWPDGPVTVVTPWAVGGVADIVNRKMATFGSEYLGENILPTNELGAGGNVALTNYLKVKPNANKLILGGEGAFSIAPNVAGGSALQFSYDDFVPIINLYSAIFVMTASVKTGVTDLESLQRYGQGKTLKVAVNGVASSEAFLAKALFRELKLKLELVSYNGANLALNSAAKGETSFAISHQSQAKSSVQAGVLEAIVVFDKTGVNNEIFRNVKGVGDYGYNAYFRNRAFLLARKGTHPEVIRKIREAYLKILETPEIKKLYQSLLIEIDPMDLKSIDEHIKNVTMIVKENR